MSVVTYVQLLPQRSWRQIIREIAYLYDLNEDDLTGPSRARDVSWPRQHCMYALKEAGWSYPRIGHFLGGRDHTTILHGVRAHRARIGGADG